MNQILNNDKCKEKKRSFVERIFHYATVKMNKMSETKKKSKKSVPKFLLENQKDVMNFSMKLLQTDVQTLTFCDYCDKEIIAEFTGQNIIYHDLCKENNERQFATESDSELEKSNELLGSIKSEKLLSSSEDVDYTLMNMKSRLSISLNDICDDDSMASIDYMLSIGSSLVQSPDVLNQCNTLLDTDSWSYTFSTADLSTIKHLGISIKNVLLDDTDRSNDNFVANIPAAATTSDTNERPQSGTLDFSGLHPDTQKMMLEVFNHNEQGLFVEHENGQIVGKIRVFINLLRPIKMLLTARPPSTFDTYQDGVNNMNQSTIDRAYYNKETIFWLPRGTTKLLYINVNCPTSDVISLLLSKFNIQNNPKKFALYEHTIKSPKDVEVCKLRSYQCPLKIMLDWCSKGADVYRQNLETKRFVLQENDPGSVEWNEFSIPELRSFARILQQEELEKRKQIESKYDILRKEIFRHMIIKNGDRRQTGRN